MADILRGRTLIGHALKNDLKCLLLDHPKSMTRDTALYRPLTRPLRADERARISGAARGRGSRSLRELCKEHLGLEIQAGEHSSVDDARAALLLYRKCAVAWERELRTAGVHTQAERRNTHKASAKRSAERHANHEEPAAANGARRTVIRRRRRRRRTRAGSSRGSVRGRGKARGLVPQMTMIVDAL